MALHLLISPHSSQSLQQGFVSIGVLFTVKLYLININAAVAWRFLCFGICRHCGIYRADRTCTSNCSAALVLFTGKKRSMIDSVLEACLFHGLSLLKTLCLPNVIIQYLQHIAYATVALVLAYYWFYYFGLLVPFNEVNFGFAVLLNILSGVG